MTAAAGALVVGAVGLAAGIWIAGGSDNEAEAPIGRGQEPAANDDTGPRSSGADDSEGAPASEEPPTVVDVDALRPSPDTEERLYGISPDGQTLLVSEGDARDTLCVRDIDAERPRSCEALDGAVWDAAPVSWSDDDRIAASPNRSYVVERRVDLAPSWVIDTETGTVSGPGEQAVSTDDDGEPSHLFGSWVAVSPDGSAVASIRSSTVEGDETLELVLIDPATGEIDVHPFEREDPGGLHRIGGLHWGPEGRQLWLSDESEGRIAAIDIEDGTTRSLDATVAFGERIPDDPGGRLVQISQDGRVGLLELTQLLGTHVGAPNVPFFAVIDLEDGRTAPVLPVGPGDEDAVDYALQLGARLAPSGDRVTIVAQDDVSGPDGDRDTDILIFSVPVDALLDGEHEEELVVDGLAEQGSLPLPLELATFLLDAGRVFPLPADGDVLLVPVWKDRWHSEQTLAPYSLDHYLRVRADRPW